MKLRQIIILVALSCLSFCEDHEKCERFNSAALKYFFTGETTPESVQALELAKRSGSALYDFGDFEGCVALPFAEYFRFSSYNSPIRIAFGLCLYKECSVHQVKKFVSELRYQIGVKYPRLNIPHLNVTRPRRDDFNINIPDRRFAFVFLPILVFVLFLNAFAFVSVHCFNSKNSNLLVFEPLSNLKSLLKPYSPSNTSCLHGIRFFSMICVIYGHVFMNNVMEDQIRNMEVQKRFLSSLVGAFTYSCFYAVDVFFLLSGFLFRLTVSKNKLIQGNASVFKKIMLPLTFRYVRMLPILLVTVFGVYNIIDRMGQGLFQDFSQFVCMDGLSKVWHIFLFINNFTGLRCQSHLWYLANDMQFFVFSLFVVVLVKNREKQDKIFILTLFASIVASFAISWAKNLGYNRILFRDREDQDFSEAIYEKPYCRIQPYLIGLLLANFHLDFEWKSSTVYELVNQKLLKSKAKRWIYLGFGLFMIYCTLWSTYYAQNLDERMNIILAGVLNGTVKTVFSVGVGIVIHLCFLGKLEGFNKAMSASFYSVFTKIGYSVYMLHISVILLFIMNQNSSVQVSGQNFFLITVTVFALTSLAGLVATAVFDSPVARLVSKLKNK